MKIFHVTKVEPNAASPRLELTLHTMEPKGEDFPPGKALQVVRDHEPVCTGSVKQVVPNDAHAFVFERHDDGREFLGLKVGDEIQVGL